MTSALDIRTQSSYCCWCQYLPAATGSPYTSSEAAFAGAATPSATAPATTARVIVLAAAAIRLAFMVGPFSFRSPVIGIPHRGGLLGELRAVGLGGVDDEVVRLLGG